MHSFQNGNSLKIKQDNWAQIEKFFAKRELFFPPNLVEDLIHLQHDSHNRLFQFIYPILTQREAPESSSRFVSSDEPNYAKTTISNALKDKANLVRLLTEGSDVERAQAEVLVHTMKEELQVEKPEKIDNLPRGMRPMESPVKPQNISNVSLFKSVQIRQSNKTAAEVRVGSSNNASRMPTTRVDNKSEGSFGASIANSGIGGTMRPNGYSANKGISAVSITPILEQACLSVLKKSDETNVMERHERENRSLLSVFVEDGDKFPTIVFDELAKELNSAMSVIQESLKQPSEYHVFTQFMTNLMRDNLQRSSAILVLTAIFEKVAHRLARLSEVDDDIALSMFLSYGVPLFKTILNSGLIMDCFVRIAIAHGGQSPAQHIHLIKQLKQSFDNDAFSLLMPMLASKCTCLNNEQVVDMYLFIVVSSLSGNPTNRLSAIRVLTGLAEEVADDVVQLFNDFIVFEDDFVVEVRARLFILLGLLLKNVDSSEIEMRQVISDKFQQMVSKSAPTLVHRGILQGLAYASVTCDWAVGYLLNVLENVASEVRLHACGLPTNITLQSLHDLVPINKIWNYSNVFISFVHSIESRELLRFEAEHFEILQALILSQMSIDQQLKEDLLISLQQYIFVGLADDLVTMNASNVLELLCQNEIDIALKMFPCFTAALRLIYPLGPSACQSNVAELLLRIKDFNPKIKTALMQILESSPTEVVNTNIVQHIIEEFTD
eukprot:TRINITY_DN845_c0_g1_i1.p1 TRINITY_DN845_c0_g1~~TRINITY_DN845_c0_g1_i1.p1  ORF type:complete len:777 (+),score=207.18 TRINITY_DN845_c0_g1_i1:167-2332(+)